MLRMRIGCASRQRSPHNSPSLRIFTSSPGYRSQPDARTASSSDSSCDSDHDCLALGAGTNLQSKLSVKLRSCTTSGSAVTVSRCSASLRGRARFHCRVIFVASRPPGRELRLVQKRRNDSTESEHLIDRYNCDHKIQMFGGLQGLPKNIVIFRVPPTPKESPNISHRTCRGLFSKFVEFWGDLLHFWEPDSLGGRGGRGCTIFSGKSCQRK